jgi:uncharacterized protein with HEPN domain
MSKRDYRLYLKDMLDACEAIQGFVKGKRKAELKRNRMLRDALIKNLETIGECSKQVPLSIRRKHAGIEWKKIAGLRDILVHQYFNVDLDILWDVVRTKAPELRKKPSSILKEEKRS